MTQRAFTLDGRSVAFMEGDTLLDAMLRVGELPTAGGCLCFGGDCPHCVATVEGVSYVRTCQTPAEEGIVVSRHPVEGDPPLPPGVDSHAASATNRHVDVVVVGAGESGRAAAAEASAAGRRVAVLDAAAGEEVIGIYAGPMVVARTPRGMLNVHCRSVVVAAGAAEIQPVCPGSDLAGIVTGRAAERMATRQIEMGRVFAVGSPPAGVAAAVDDGELVRFEGEAGRVTAVVVRRPDGTEVSHECDTAAVGLGLQPRDALFRMARDLDVRLVGEAAEEATIPPCPRAGLVCPCAGVTVDDLDSVWQRGFREMELVKRATLAGTGTCQGAACLPHLRSFLADRGAELPPPFTARPVTRQVTFGEVSAGWHLPAVPRTALDAEHRALGAHMDRVGGWWRPWHYGDVDAEYHAVRHAVSVGDVSTLGKMIVTGPGAAELVERLYPTRVADLAPGRARYVLMLNERGYVADDGLVCREDETRFILTFTSGGSTWAEMWVRDWAASWGLDVRIMNTTTSLGAVNVTGPGARDLLALAGVAEPPGYMRHAAAEVAGVPCRIFRLSFTGELSYELHHPAERSAELWRALLGLGRGLGIAPHGVAALLRLRLEKGHVIVGQDTDFDSTPRRLGLPWAVKTDKPDFIGKQAVLRTDAIPLDKQLVGFEMDGEAPLEGAVIRVGDAYAGYVTSSTASPVLGRAVMLGWLRLFDGALPDAVTIDGRPARRASLPFYDPEGARARG